MEEERKKEGAGERERGSIQWNLLFSAGVGYRYTDVEIKFSWILYR